MTDLISKLASAIATQEGWFASKVSLSRVNNNPGNLTASPLQRQKDIRGFVKFSSEAEGIAALQHQVSLEVLRGLTLREFIYKYAPPNENNSEVYLSNVEKWLGVEPDTKLLTFLDLVDVRKVK